YLEFLGDEAKRGTLQEEDLPLFGWPSRRLKGWRRNLWLCPWLRQVGDLLEPYMFLPVLLTLAWLLVLMENRFSLGPGTRLALAVLLVAMVLSALCIAWVWWENRNEQEQEHLIETPMAK